MLRFFALLFVGIPAIVGGPVIGWADAALDRSQSFLRVHCADCHGDGGDDGGFELTDLKSDLDDEANSSLWARVLDRVASGEMPPPDAQPPTSSDVAGFVAQVTKPLHQNHASRKGTTLRRLNRREYQNTMNDLFGTNLDLESRLPEDGRSHEFDNVGKTLGLSMVHLEQYLAAAEAVLDASIASRSAPPPRKTRRVTYAETREGKKHIGSVWEQLDDGSVVFYQDFGYPTGMLRGTEPDPPGRYQIRITGYAYRSHNPITFRVGGTSFQAGSTKPTYGYFELPSRESNQGKAATVEFETWIDDRYMIEITPWGLVPDNYNIRKDGIGGYQGPGLAITHLEIDGPILDGFPSRGHQWLFEGIDRREVQPSQPDAKTKSWYVPRFEVVTDEPIAVAKKSLARMTSTAFRRPVSDEMVQPYLELFGREYETSGDFETAFRAAVSAVFCSPDFLYFHEPPGWLDGHAVANRLSYFLNRTSPDARLRHMADRQAIAKRPQVLLDQTKRLIEDTKFDRFVEDFCDAWLNLRDLEFTSPDQNLFPEYDGYLLHSMKQETLYFVRQAIRENWPVTDLVDSQVAMINERLADHYQIDDVRGPEIRPVRLDSQSVRGGLLGQASILKVSANGTNTSPVVRGVWVAERLVGVTPPPPPPGIPGVEPDIRGASTLRELLDKHRDSDACRNCHALIDPPGFALESFNPIGGWRDRYRSLGKGDKVDLQINNRRVRYKLGLPVDASGKTNDGTSFDGFRQFRNWLAKDDERLARTMIIKWLTFATGREMGFSDRPIIDKLVQQSKTKNHGLRDMIDLVVTSEIFRRK